MSSRNGVPCYSMFALWYLWPPPNSIRHSLAIGKEEEYDVSFVGGKLHILRKSFDFRTGVKNGSVRPNYTHILLLITNS